jgi:hypothetical protein
MIRVVVSTPTSINFGGRRHGFGDEIEVEAEVARKWLAAGWVKAASEAAARERGLAESEAAPEQMLDHHRNVGRES